jgi:hypothetical protein
MWIGRECGMCLAQKGEGDYYATNLYQCNFFTHRNNNICNQQRFIYIFVTSKHFSIQTVSYYESIIFCTLLMPLKDCNSNSKWRGTEKCHTELDTWGGRGWRQWCIYITICLSICP